MDTRPLTNCGRSALTKSTRSSERSGRSRSAAMTSRRSRTTTPTPPSRILDLCGSWICCSRFFPGGCPRIGTLDSRRFLSIPVDSSPLGLGTRGTRRAVASTSGAACTRGSVRAHCRAGGITPRSVPQRNPACGMAGGNRVWAGPDGRSRRPGRINVSRLVQS